jgi:hypothetical protein
MVVSDDKLELLSRYHRREYWHLTTVLYIHPYFLAFLDLIEKDISVRVGQWILAAQG